MDGGGCRPSFARSTLKPILAVAVMVAVVFLVLQAPSSDAELTGDGTLDNPYSGHVTELETFAYYTVGTTFDVDIGYYGEKIVVTDDVLEISGLHNDKGHITGTLQASGIFYATGGDGQVYTINVPYVLDTDGELCFVDNTEHPVAGLFWNIITWSFSDPNNVYFWNTMSGIDSDGGYGDLAGYPDIDLDENGYADFCLEFHWTEGSWQDYYQRCLAYPDFPLLNTIKNIDMNYDGRVIEVKVDSPEIFSFMGTYFAPTIFVSEGEFIWQIVEIKEVFDECCDVPIPTPEREGYRFTGWFEDPGCTIPWEFMTAQDWLDLNGDLSGMNPARYIYAGWEPLESPFTATSGSGTEDDPYEGTLTSTDELFYADYIPSEIWVSKGTVVKLDLTNGPSDPSGGLKVSITPGFGISVQSQIRPVMTYIGGTLEAAGDCVISCEGQIQFETTLHIVSDVSELMFLSDPSDPLYATISYGRT